MEVKHNGCNTMLLSSNFFLADYRVYVQLMSFLSNITCVFIFLWLNFFFYSLYFVIKLEVFEI